MKAWELELDKVYTTPDFPGLKYKLNPVYRLLVNGGHGYMLSEMAYNDIVRINFEEIQQPMTFEEAMEWMAEKPHYNICKYTGSDRKLAVDREGGLYNHYPYGDSPRCPVFIDMVKGEWFKVEK